MIGATVRDQQREDAVLFSPSRVLGPWVILTSQVLAIARTSIPRVFFDFVRVFFAR